MRELLHAPPFKAVQAFSLIASPFGSDAPLPTGTNSSPRSHPVLEIFFFTKQGKLVYRWAEGGLSNDENFVHASPASAASIHGTVSGIEILVTESSAWRRPFGHRTEALEPTMG